MYGLLIIKLINVLIFYRRKLMYLANDNRTSC